MIPRSAVPVSAPPRVAEQVRTAADGTVPVLHRGRHAVYVELAGRCVGVVGRDAAQVPCALRTAAPDLGELRGESAHVSSGVLHLDGTPLTVGRIGDVQVPAIKASLAGPADATVARLVPGLVGRGGGLTPEGDDVLCGWLAVHRAAGVATPRVDGAVRAHLPRTTLLSATLLECAMHGEALPQFSAWLTALGTPDQSARAAALRAVGHSSGAALLNGARLALTGRARPLGAAA